MYTCNKCKGQFEGHPARKQGKNYKINLCEQCSQELNDIATAKMRQRTEQIALQNRCKWCDDHLHEHNRARATKSAVDGKEYNSNLCIDCDSDSSYRKWLEKCLTNSETIIKYLNNPSRQEKWKQAREVKKIKETLPLLDQSAAQVDEQLFREFMQFKAFMAQKKGSR